MATNEEIIYAIKETNDAFDRKSVEIVRDHITTQLQTLKSAKKIFDEIFPDDQLSPEQLAAGEAQLAQFGIKVKRNAAGVAGKIQLPSGEIIDVIQGAGIGKNVKQFLVVDPYPPGFANRVGRAVGGALREIIRWGRVSGDTQQSNVGFTLEEER